MTKDRFHELMQAQNGQISINMETIPETENSIKDENKELRKTFERAEVIRQWIESIEKNNQDAREYLKRIEDVKCNQKDVESKIQSLFQKNTSIAQQITNTLKEIDNEITKINLESAEGRIKGIQYTTLKTRFQEAFIESTQQLENYKRSQKQMLQAQLNAKGKKLITDEELTSLIEDGKDIQLFTENILMETAEAKRQLADIEERHQHLLKIERMLVEVRDLFVQMSILIDTQKELIDRVEYQAQVATNYVGAVDLGKIRRSKKRYVKRKIYCFLIVIIVVIILLIILFK